MTYESFTLNEMSPACGGIIEGIDLSQDLTNRQFDEIHDALLDRTVIIFRPRTSAITFAGSAPYPTRSPRQR